MNDNEYPQIPLGLGMALSQHSGALNRYAALGAEKQREIISFIQSSQSGEQAKERINQTVDSLKA